MRLFVAVFPPPEAQKELRRAAGGLPVEGDVRWTPERNIHLTLKFLGDAREESLGGIGGVLENVARAREPFEVELAGFGAFPSAGKARVLWAGVGDGAEELRDLVGEVESRLEALGFEREERGYAPHVTLGRARKRPARLGEVMGTGRGLRFKARRVDLAESVTGAGGARYSTLAGYPFSRAGRRKGGLSP